VIHVRVISFSFALVLFAQSDPRIVRTTAPPECKSPVPFGVSGGKYPPGLHQFQGVALDCVASHTDDSVTRTFGAATFCGSNDSGTEQKWYSVRLGAPSPDSQRALGSFSCEYPNEIRIVPPARSAAETAPESERISRVREGMFANGPLEQAEWQSVLDSEKITVAVQRQLYAERGRFLIHVWATNKTQRPLGIDLRHRDRVIYPNVWELHRATERPAIVEARGELTRVDPLLTANLLADFRAGRLTVLRDSVDYYCGLRGRRPGGADYSGNERYLTISTDGQLLFTDGNVVRRLDLQWREGLGPRQTDVIIPIPFVVQLPPPDAWVF